jgi:DNA-binding MarR family transcriptional regulator
MTNSFKNLTSVLKAFRTANSILKGEGKDSQILLEHIEALVYTAQKKDFILKDAQKDLGLFQAKNHRVFSHLKRLGWINIVSDKEDARQRRVELTTEGLSFLALLSYKLDR